MKRLPDHLSRECIIEAIRAYDEGIAHQFKDARLYEVEFEGRRYPSKSYRWDSGHYGDEKTEFTPADFSGGIKSKCVRLLLEQGFKIVQERVDDAGITLFPDELQTKK